MRFGSVCSGIEAASVAFGPLGWKAAWFAEVEPFPSAVLAHHYPETPNLGDMTAISRRVLTGEVEAPDVLCGGTPCFTAGHMVLTSSGYRAIEDLVSGEKVMTHKGRMRKIIRTGSKVAPVGRLSAVGLPGGIVCTAEHPFLSSHWRNQNTKRAGVYAKVEACSEPEWVAAKDLPGRQWCAMSQAEPTSCKPDSRLFDERTAMYVAGMYLGDGWLRGWAGKNKRAVMLGINEAKYQKLLAVIGSASHGASREPTGIKVCFGDTAFANWLDANFGHHSHLKTLPAWVMGHPHRDALLQGYMDTDGHVEDGKLAINSTSKSLAYGVCSLLNIQGWAASVAKIETADTCEIEGRTVNQRDYFQARANHSSISRKSRVRHGYLMRTVQEWMPLGEEIVWNIEVEEDNSFILDGAVVHNCQAFSVAGLRESLADERGNLTLKFVELADAIDHVRVTRGDEPAIVFWENVPGVLSTKDNAFGCFLAGLAGEDEPLQPPGEKWANAGCVYGPARAVAWRTLDAQYFGLAQRRRRVFVVASARDGFDPATVLFEWDGVRRDSPPSRESREGSAGNVAPGVAYGGNNTSGPIDVATARNACASASASGRMDFKSETFVVHGTQDPCVSTDTAFALGRNNGGENVVVFSCKDDGGERVAMAFAQNSRDEVRLMNGDGQIVGALAAEPGMKPTCYVAQYSELEALYNKGFTTLKEGNASTQETHAGKILRALREAVGEEAFAKWGLGILDSLQQAEVLRQALHGLSIRPASFSRSWVVHCALSRQEDGPGWLLQSLRETGCEGCPPQGWEPPEQLNGELRAYLQKLSQPGAQASRFMRDLWWAAQGPGLLRQALSAVQEMGRPTGRQGQSVLRGSEGRGSEESEVVPSAGMQCEVSRERLLHEACTAGEARDSRKGTTEQERSGKGWVGETPFAVRRLTVEECEFLQGFPRGYTQIPWRKKPASDCPDGPRYRALGNSWAVTVVSWIGQRINNTLRIAA